MAVSFYLKGSKQVLLLGMEARVCLFRELPVAFAAGVQEIIRRRLQEEPAFPRAAPLSAFHLRGVKHNTPSRVSLFGFIMDRSKRLDYWGETHVSLEGKSFI